FLPTGQWEVIGPDKPVKALAGKDIVFSCFLSPETSAEDMEVRFFRSQFSNVVHIYKKGKDQKYMQMAVYQGRTELMKDSITKGHLSLRLKKVTSSDAGVYGCWFSSQTYYQEATWELQVLGIGSPPLISIMGYAGGEIQLLCQSSGWFPEPTVKWKGPQGQDFPSDSKVNTNKQGMFDVETSLIVQQNAESISCSVQHSDQNQKVESSIYISDIFFQSSPWRLAFILLLLVYSILCAGVIGNRIFNFKFQRTFLEELQLKEAQTHAVEEALDLDTAHPKLHFSDQEAAIHLHILQDTPDSREKYVIIDCLVAFQGFSSGKHYWEVNVEQEKKWFLGVCQDNMDKNGGTLSTICGYWVIGRTPENEYFTLNPNKTTLYPKTNPTKVGIFLDYEGGTISFFNISDKSLIYTLTDRFENLLKPYIANIEPPNICPVSWVSETEALFQRAPISIDTEDKEHISSMTTSFLFRNDDPRESSPLPFFFRHLRSLSWLHSHATASNDDIQMN
ncbi:PREDICTED: butyrophilin-like protein 8-like, partial [Elephantulus edwardii]|uniref:butyrophilin-like protein 8-like n=1 Tax=Elephantulus edwardii TaxID=28737 RepID=UPI0003F0BCFB